MLRSIPHSRRSACCEDAPSGSFLSSHRRALLGSPRRQSPDTLYIAVHTSSSVHVSSRMHLLGHEFQQLPDQITLTLAALLQLPVIRRHGAELQHVNSAACLPTSAPCRRPGCCHGQLQHAGQQRHLYAVVQDRHSLLGPIGNGARGPIDGIICQLRPHIPVRLHRYDRLRSHN